MSMESLIVVLNKFRLSGQAQPVTEMFHLQIPVRELDRALSCHGRYGNVANDPEFSSNLKWLENEVLTRGTHLASSKSGDTEHSAVSATHIIITGFGY
jgi:hypothetical protein